MNDELDWLDKKLRDEMPYIDDGGFTARVVQQIPVRAQRRSLRAVILLAMALLSGIATFVLSNGGRFLVEATLRLTHLPFTSLLLVAMVCGIAVTAVSTAATLLTQATSRG